MFTAREQYLTKAQVAQLLNVTPRTIDNFMRRGFLVYHKIGGMVRFRMGDIEKHLNERTRVCR
jgi:excisionase family DNA binding protein